MAARSHEYRVEIVWQGDRGTGTSGYRDYGREHRLCAPGKADVAMSSDPAFRGEKTRWNPEETLVASLSSCHMLWYLHLAAEAGVVVRSYEDSPIGTMAENADGNGRFTDVVLQPRIEISAGDLDKAIALHHDAHRNCFVANSVNFPVRCEPRVSFRQS